MGFTANKKMDAILVYLNSVYDEINTVTYYKLDGITSHIPNELPRSTRNNYEILWGARISEEKQDYIVSEFDLILDYLENGGLIEKIGNEYKILWKGKIFIEAGGYCHLENQNNLEERKLRISRTLNWIIAFGVTTPFLWYLLDVLRNWYPLVFRPIHDYVLPYGLSLFLLWLLYIALKLIHIKLKNRKHP